MATRYTFTIAFAGAGAFNPSLFDALTAGTLRVLGATNVQPAVVVSSVSVPTQVYEGGRAFVLPEGGEPVPTELSGARLVITKISRTFDATLPTWPWDPSLCAASGLSTRECGRYTSAGVAAQNALFAGIRDGLPGSYQTIYPYPRGEAALVAPSSGYGGLFAVLAVVGGYAYYATRSSPLRGLGRVPVATKTNRLRKLAQRRRHEGRFMEARRLEQRANRLSRSS